jgi:hypothetical protein
VKRDPTSGWAVTGWLGGLGEAAGARGTSLQLYLFMLVSCVGTATLANCTPCERWLYGAVVVVLVGLEALVQ